MSEIIQNVPNLSQLLNANLNMYVALETSFKAHDRNKRIPKKVQILLLQWKNYVHCDHWQLKVIYTIEMVGHLHYKNIHILMFITVA